MIHGMTTSSPPETTVNGVSSTYTRPTIRIRSTAAHHRSSHRRRLGAAFGGRTNFRGPKFANDLFLEKIAIFTLKISNDLF